MRVDYHTCSNVNSIDSCAGEQPQGYSYYRQLWSCCTCLKLKRVVLVRLLYDCCTGRQVWLLGFMVVRLEIKSCELAIINLTITMYYNLTNRHDTNLVEFRRQVKW